MTIEAGDILKIVLEYVYPGAGTALNIFHYVFAGGDQEDDDILQAVEDFFTNDWGVSWQDLAAGDTEMDFFTVQTVDSAGLVIRDVGSRLLNISGGLMGTVSPAANSSYMQANTSSPQVRGSKYVPGLAEDATAAGILEATAVVALTQMLADYVSQINLSPGDNLFPGVISTRLAGFTIFAGNGLINSIPAYQRRRKIGVGS